LFVRKCERKYCTDTQTKDDNIRNAVLNRWLACQITIYYVMLYLRMEHRRYSKVQHDSEIAVIWLLKYSRLL